MEIPEENIQQESQSSAQPEREASGQSGSMSQEEAFDLLYRYDGFEELIGPLAENLEKFSPENESKKKRFLQDEDLVPERLELKDRLEAYVQFLSSGEVSDHKSLRKLSQSKLEQNEELINENVDNILKESRDLERTYRELETFFRNAAPQKTANLRLLNINSETLLDADSNMLYNEVEKMILTESKSVDQRDAYSMLVIPELWRSTRPKDLIERYTKLSGDARMSFLTDFADADSVEEAIEERESKRWKGVTGAENHHSKLIMFANHLTLRGKHEGMEKDEDLRGSVAMAVAGKMYAEKISQPIMGEMHGSLANTQGLAYRTVQDEVTDLSNLGLNSTMNAFDKDMVYDSCTAFDGSEYALKRYPVVRTFDYVNRVLRHYLGKVTGQQLDRPGANHVRETIQDFLNQLVEQKIISSGKVAKFEWNSRVPDRIDVQIDIQPLWAVRTFVYALKAKDRSAESELKEVN
jgi:hypothetical protein